MNLLRILRLLVLPALCAGALAMATPAGAIVPPKNCGTTTVKNQRYTIKADQLRCSTAKPHARRYLSTGRKPSGYRCTNYKASQTKLKFRCSKGNRVFFAIRR